jgi:hypothetical protein
MMCMRSAGSEARGEENDGGGKTTATTTEDWPTLLRYD